MTDTTDRKWGLEFVSQPTAVECAKRMGPGPFWAVPFAFFTSLGERTQYAIALWIPALEQIGSDYLATVDAWIESGRRVMIRPLYFGPEGHEFEGENLRPYQRRVVLAKEAEIWHAVADLVIHLGESDSAPGLSWAEVKVRMPELTGFWQIPFF